MPRAAEMPTRSPVKLPGPTVTATRSSSREFDRAASITRAISGISASAWPRTMRQRFAREDRALLGIEHGGRAGVERGIDGKDAHEPDAAVRLLDVSAHDLNENRFPCLGPARPRYIGRTSVHVRHEMAQQVLDAVLQRRGRGRAARAGALHGEKDDAVLEAAEGDVAAVIGDRRTHARLDQFLDGGDRLGVVGVEEFVGLAAGVAVRPPSAAARRT